MYVCLCVYTLSVYLLFEEDFIFSSTMQIRFVCPFLGLIYFNFVKNSLQRCLADNCDYLGKIFLGV